MCVSQNVWMYLFYAAIGGIISFLLLKFWNLPQNEATRNLKIPVEHDERGQEMMPTLYSGEWKCFEEMKGKKNIDKLPNISA